MLIILPTALVGSYLLLSLIIKLVSQPWRRPQHGADYDKTRRWKGLAGV